MTSNESTSTLAERSPDNVRISEFCPACGKRRWLLDEERKTERTYHAPPWLRGMIKRAVGNQLLGQYYVDRCEVCGLTMAVFTKNRGVMANEVIVLYACSLLSSPVDSSVCAGRDSCYNCPAKENPLYVDRK